MPTKISQLPTLSAVTPTTVFPVVDGGSTKQVTAATLATYVTATVVTSSLGKSIAMALIFNG
jgi:hypothetical protein